MDELLTAIEQHKLAAAVLGWWVYLIVTKLTKFGLVIELSDHRAVAWVNRAMQRAKGEA